MRLWKALLKYLMKRASFIFQLTIFRSAEMKDADEKTEKELIFWQRYRNVSGRILLAPWSFVIPGTSAPSVPDNLHH